MKQDPKLHKMTRQDKTRPFLMAVILTFTHSFTFILGLTLSANALTMVSAPTVLALVVVMVTVRTYA